MLQELEPLMTTWGAYAFVVVLGLLWGSFANVCIYRWPPSKEFPRGRSVVAPGSHCFACKTPIKWYDNVPLVSWLWLRGQCRACKAPFSGRYLIVEALTGVLFGVSWFMAIETHVLRESLDLALVRFAVYAAFCFVMVVISFIDLDHKLILDKVTLPSIVLFYALGLALGRTWYAGLIGAAIGYGLPWTIGEVYWLVTDREGLGLGDSTLLAVIGALMGTTGVIASLFGGSILGAVIGVLALLRGGAASPDGDADAEGAPPRSRASAVLAVVSVAAVVAAVVFGLQGSVAISAGGCVIALLALVLSRYLEPGIEDEDDDEPEVVGTRTLAVRVLALLGGAGVLAAVMSVVLGWLVLSASAAVAGIGLVLLARRAKGVDNGVEEAADDGEADEPPPDETSLLRTELPFGPFLALAAVAYLFAEPWVILQFRFPGG